MNAPIEPNRSTLLGTVHARLLVAGLAVAAVAIPLALAATPGTPALASLALASPAGPASDADTTPEADAKTKIRSLIHRAYFDGAFNACDTEAMAAGFHPDFAIFSARGDQLARYEIGTWIEAIDKATSSPNYHPDESRMEGKIVALDVTGGAAQAKIELREEGTLVYTDYLSMLRFDGGWRIVAKVYHKHE